ncbi:transmembrane protein, putative (macronuclear) [Tetrahymena thermophila SB210]|uniref:Transmembrane protein, putative n=1 Tax=Tetrahymena thermophila (strain SB210) TaxID=312017 RepID=Q23G31_TETTS|nr:transmembrane protein, putative [Tetrahymena thermophila SB210]EAR95429.2 transmembrane protein, putative [Tetrahymena thermophila SB210]|eukprot:XP_001015674.2 transmembrane protein, putative [Tetrahymena thermophila SB210]
MNQYKFDLFSSHFFFKVNGKSIKQGTSIGSCLSFLTFSFFLIYLLYLLIQYFTNQIDPTYRAQNFTNNDSVHLELENDLISFRYESDYNLSIDVLQAQTNKTYIVYKAYFLYTNQTNYEMIPINIIKCNNPSLEGFYCLDYSMLSNSTLVQNNIEKIQSQIQIFVYGCLDIDFQKTTIPDNCASQQEIDNLFNAINSALKVQIKTTQYNVKLKQFQTAFRYSQLFTLSNQYLQGTLKVQQQKTTVKQGLFFQSETNKASPLQYDYEVQTLDRSSAIQLMNLSCYCQSSIVIDQLYQQVYIQYPTIPAILAIANSMLSIMLLLGFIGRRFSLKIIDQKFFMILFQNLFQQSYLQILTQNKLIEKYQDQIQQPNKQQQSQPMLDKTSESEERSGQFENESVIDKSNSLSPCIYFKPMKMLNVQNQIRNKDETFQSILMENQAQQKDERILSFQSQKEPAAVESCNQSKEIHKKENKFQEKQFKNKSCFQKQVLEKNNNIKNNNQDIHVQKKQNPCKNQQNKTLIQNKNQQQDNNKYNLIIKSLQCNKIEQQLKKILNQSSCCSKNKVEDKQKKLNDLQKQNIQDLLDKELDIYHFYQDILFLKKAVMILFSQDQLAALQLVGCSSQFLEQDFKKLKKGQLKTQKSLSHYEEQFAIQLSDELKLQNTIKFIRKCQDNKNLTNIDLRILQSIQNSIDS